MVQRDRLAPYRGRQTMGGDQTDSADSHESGRPEETLTEAPTGAPAAAERGGTRGENSTKPQVVLMILFVPSGSRACEGGSCVATLSYSLFVNVHILIGGSGGLWDRSFGCSLFIGVFWRVSLSLFSFVLEVSECISQGVYSGPQLSVYLINLQ